MASQGETQHRTHGELTARAEHSGAASFLLPLQRYVRHLVVAGAAMLVGAVIGLAWANSPWSGTYHTIWTTPVRVSVGATAVRLDLHGLVVDGLMTGFFLLAALEVKREVVAGELANLRRAAFPLAAAVGGIVVPAGLFLAINLALPDGRPDAWGIPVATDIAFSLAVLALIGPAGPVRTLLLSMAVADDVAGILIIAVAYAGDIRFAGLALAGLLLLLAWGMVRAGVGAVPLYLAVGVAMWVVLQLSGIHPTIAGVAMALIVPVRPVREPAAALEDIRQTVERAQVAARHEERALMRSQQALGRIGAVAASSESPADRIGRLLMPWTRFVVLPLFAVAAAGVEVPLDRIGEVATSPLALGIFVGLAIGKPVGILAAAWIAHLAGIAEPPEGLGWPELVGVGLLAGIGFTVALFIAGLAVDDTEAAQAATLAVLAASAVSAAAALLWLGPARRWLT